MTNPNLKDELASATQEENVPADAAEPGEEELSATDLDIISGGLEDASGKCGAMACGVY